jgi:hypothetical protein
MNDLMQTAFMYKPGFLQPFIHWFNHSRLQGFMSTLKCSQGSVPSEDFDRLFDDMDYNLTPIQLKSDDLDNLEQAIENFTMPMTLDMDGTSDYLLDSYNGNTCLYYHQDLMFVAMAREKIAQGYEVWYCANYIWNENS